ncbi:MAG: alpha-2-macroglobulin, partial [Treponema sp.]|nr:alpha-2-macroglobulin [Treponema sp.]
MNKNKYLYFFLLFLAVVFSIFIFTSCKKKDDFTATAVFSASHVSPGRAAPGLGSYRIAYYEAVPGGEIGGAGIQESDEPFRIVDYGPYGELPSEIKKPSIYVVFSQPVVHLARLGEPIREDAGLFTIVPPLKGIYRWYGTRLLSFEPDGESMPQMEYRVTVSDRIKSLGGKNLEGEKTFTFETERLSVLEWRLGAGDTWVSPWDADPLEAKNISLIFSYPVNLGEIAKWMTINASGQNFAFTLSRLPEIDKRQYKAEQGVLLTLNGTLPQNTDVNLRILAGARSEANWLGSKEERLINFHTLRPFRFNDISVRSDSSPRTEEGDSIPIYLYFSHPVDPEISPSLFSVQGMPALTRDNIRVYG